MYILKKADKSTRAFLVFLIILYQKTFSPNHSFVIKYFYPHGFCRFYPTCSMYAFKALRRYNLYKAIGFIISRLLRCHPWSRGGFDFLPSETDKK